MCLLVAPAPCKPTASSPPTSAPLLPNPAPPSHVLSTKRKPGNVNKNHDGPSKWKKFKQAMVMLVLFGTPMIMLVMVSAALPQSCDCSKNEFNCFPADNPSCNLKMYGFILYIIFYCVLIFSVYLPNGIWQEEQMAKTQPLSNKKKTFCLLMDYISGLGSLPLRMQY